MSKTTDKSPAELQQLLSAIQAAQARKLAANERAILAAQRRIEREVVGTSTDVMGVRRGRIPKVYIVDFRVPVRRQMRLISSAGHRAFHCGFTSVTRTRTLVVKSDGQRNYTSAASVHVRYLEDGSTSVSAHVPYIDSSRVDLDEDSVRLVISNISDSHRERVEFFKLVDDYERKRGSDRIDIDFGRNRDIWLSIAADRRCDPALARGISNPDASGRNVVTISLEGSANDTRQLLRKHGLTDGRTKISKGTNSDYLARDGFVVREGRGGRTQYRVVLEVPSEFNARQRKRLLKRLCARMDREQCMYIAVIHAPDAHKDDRNFHIHLDFYDRPCRRLTNDEQDLPQVDESIRSTIAKEIAEGKFSYCEGRWDFTVPRVSPERKTSRPHYPFRVDKVDIVRPRDYPKSVRFEFAKDVNTIAAQDGLSTIYDPRQYAEMGILAPVSKKLNSKMNGLELKGTATTVGIQNELDQALFERQMINRSFAQAEHDREALVHRIAHAASTDAIAKHSLLAAVEKLRLRNELERALALLRLEQSRSMSRALLIADRSDKIAREKAGNRRTASAILAAEARSHLNIMQVEDAEDLSLPTTCANFLEGLPTAPDFEQQIASCQQMTSRVAACLKRAEDEYWPITLVRQDGRLWPVVRPPAGAFAPSDAYQTTVEMKVLLAPLYARQREDHAFIRRAVQMGALQLVTRQSPSGSDPIVTANDPALHRLWKKYSLHADLRHEIVESLRAKHQNEQLTAEAAKERRALSQQLAHQLAAGAASRGSMPWRDQMEGHINRTMTTQHKGPSDAQSQMGHNTPDIQHGDQKGPVVSTSLSEDLDAKATRSDGPHLPIPETDKSVAGKQSQVVQGLIGQTAHDHARVMFEREMLVHQVRTKRLRLVEEANGKIVIPADPDIPSEWHQHIPTIIYELRQAKKAIEEELRIYSANARRGAQPTEASAFFENIFVDDPLMREALRIGASIRAQRLSVHALQLSRGIG